MPKVFVDFNAFVRALHKELPARLKEATDFKTKVNGSLASYGDVAFSNRASLKFKEGGFYKHAEVAMGYRWDPDKPSAEKPDVVSAFILEPIEGPRKEVLLIHEPETELAKVTATNIKAMAAYLLQWINQMAISSPENFRYDLKMGKQIAEIYDDRTLSRFLANKELVPLIMQDLYALIVDLWQRKFSQGQSTLDPSKSEGRHAINTLANFYVLCTGNTQFTTSQLIKLSKQKRFNIAIIDVHPKVVRIRIGDMNVLLYSTGLIEDINAIALN
jgi:hypothetical protein